MAGATDQILGRRIDAVCDHTVAEVLGMDAAALAASAQGSSEPVYLGSVAVAGATLCLTAHDRDGIRILEIEPSSPLPQNTAEVLAQARRTAASFDRALDHSELLQTAAREARRLTGFDRVMIYRFLRDGSGSVVAENREEALPPLLNHRYPASDIPKQARELYLRNLIRVIPDVSYTPAPLVPPLNPATKAPLDMSDCSLRSVSPIHVQYLKNMNVAASMSVSIVVDGALWGLVAFHHMSPKLVPYELREMCKHLGEILSQQVKAREDAEASRRMLDLTVRREGLLGSLSKTGAIDLALFEYLPELGSVLPADGAAVLFGDSIGATHSAPSQAQVRDLVDWLLDTGRSGVFATNALVGQYPPAAEYAHKASGLLATVVSREEPVVLLWFRAEQLETINWAGNPHTPAEPGAAIGALNPRKSFEIWTVEARDEQVRAQFGSASDRIMAIAMVHRRLWQTDHIQSIDFAFYLEEIRDGLVETWGPEWDDQVTVHGQRIVVSTDIAVVLALVVIELLTNAAKYAYGGRPGPVDVSIQQTSLGLDVVVKDRGIGMPTVQSKQGLGSQLTRGLIDDLNGELQVDSSTQGTSIVISVPLRGDHPVVGNESSAALENRDGERA